MKKGVQVLFTHEICGTPLMAGIAHSGEIAFICPKCSYIWQKQNVAGINLIPPKCTLISVQEFNNQINAVCKPKNQPKKQSSKPAPAVKGKRPSQSATSAKSRSKKSPSPRAKN